MARKFASKSKPVQKKVAEPKQTVDNEEKEPKVNPDTTEDLKAELKQPVAKPETNASSVPTVDPDASLKIDKEKETAASVPQVSTNDELKIEKETGFLKEESTQNTQDQPLIEEITSEQINKKNYKLFIFGLLIATVVTALTIGYFFLSAKKDTSQPTPNQSPTAEKVEEKTSAYNRSDWSIEVLNGSTKAGAASKLAKSLETLGYKITKTGNADNKNYEKSVVLLGSDIEKYKDDFLADLKNGITIPNETGSLKDSTASAQIIIGEDK